MSSIAPTSSTRQADQNNTHSQMIKIGAGLSLISAVASTAIAAAAGYGVFAVSSTVPAIFLGVVAVISGVIAIKCIIATAGLFMLCCFRPDDWL